MRVALLLSFLSISLSGFSQDYYLFIGTYTSGKSKGIYVYDFNASTGKAHPISDVTSKNPSYLALSNGGNFLYAVNENGDGNGDVSAFSFDRKSGQLQFINKQSSGGNSPCYISVNKDRNWAVVANYGGGSLSALPIQSDGSLAPIAEIIQHKGKGVDSQRQESAHVHSAFFTPDEKTVLSADLGLDKLMIYHFNESASLPLTGAKDSFAAIVPGSGPRHLAFHPSKPYLYLLEEMTGTIDAFSYHSDHLTARQRIQTTPAGFKGSKGSADIHITPNGRFLYASNRGDADNIAIYTIDGLSGKLHSRGFQSVLGKHPRNFIIDPSGRFLLVANRDTDNIIIFRIDQQTGLLKATGEEIKIPNPVCLKLLKK